jgi:hypothetical protein
MAALSTAAVVLASLLGPRTDERTLVAFYRRVEPPGWWRHTARAAGADPRGPNRALARGLLAVLAAATTAYGLLVGVGTLALQPDAHFTAAALLIAALAAAPYWMRRL